MPKLNFAPGDTFGDLEGYYVAPLTPGKPEKGFGVYELGTGRCCYYSDGKSPWFFEMAGGRPAFCVRDGKLYPATD